MLMKPYISYQDALLKLQSYCAYQERCHKEVRYKLIELGIYGEELDSIIIELIEHNFLNEERYAIAYAGGKFRIKKWGKVRIIRDLKQNDISEYCIKKAINSELPDDDYAATLQEVIDKRSRMVKDKNPFRRRQKIALYVIEKGFESTLVWDILNK